MNVLLVSGDLLIGSQVAGAAERVGASLQTARDRDRAVEICQHEPIDLVLVDLSTDPLDIGSLVPALRDLAAPPARILAFGPHVHESKLQAAREAGCEEVFSRGELHAKIEQILSGR